ncbi:DUF7523 family protein [Haloarcula argentinensis]|uniref:Uncharacterized protein n=1 Tax=Haloarcula argentinensis TaxID=43776 RepID=A0A830FKS0_HALAR|nr:hypothetical protein [Haloarcula argentinensis]EMA18722.1 hypothetical protein C443_19539 [Haloarcula argentinensis DSM 12282]MDS0253716.1 hypothetical protein [Haloarcula argentinensis]GGM47296.1 hypothetical protein GCM10009006_30640 [Haloarcula argentinensis]
MSLAAATRDAVRERPFLYDALRAGVVNYTAAARTLDIDGEEEAIATALRRFAEELPADSPHDSDARVSMQSGLGRVESPSAESALVLQVGDAAFAEGAGSLTGIIATGDLAPAALGEVLGRLRATDVSVDAAAVTGEALVVVVSRRGGPDALRVVEATVQG